MGNTFKTGNYVNGIFQDASNNIGIGGSPSGSYKFEVTGASRIWDGTQGFNIRAFTAGAGYGAIYSTQVTPSNTNFALVSNGASTYLNATNDAGISIDNGTKGIFLVSTGRVGIGTTTPAELVEVSAPAVAGTSQQARLRITQAGSISARANLVSGVISGENPYFAIETRQSASPFAIVERLRIDGNGNVGIGTSSPDRLLQISRTSGQAVFSIIAADNDSADIFFGDTNNNAEAVIRFINGTNSLGFLNGGTERMRITSGGNLLIGTTTDPGFKMHINGGSNGFYLRGGTSSSNSALIVNSSDDSTTYFRVRGDGYLQSLTTYNNTTASGANVAISSSGYFERSTSSIKYKKDVKDYDKGLAEVMQMRPVYYKGKGENDGDKQFAGLIAEEIDALGLNEFVQYADDETPDALYYANMVALLTKSIQELSAKVSALENKS
jgi:hypothetical protein